MQWRKHVGGLKVAAGACALTIAAAGAAGAHHAITLNYDSDSSGTIEGVVEEVFWANPHVHIYLAVAADDGSTQLWDIETGNLNVMRNRGITRDAIQVGDRLSVTGILGRDGAHAILADTVLKDGDVMWGTPAETAVAENYGEQED